MPARLLAFSVVAYRVLLNIYPAPFQKRFAAEMAQVFRSLSHQVYTESGSMAVLALWLSAAWDGLLGAVYQWFLYLRKQRIGFMNIESTDLRDGTVPLSPLQNVLAVLPFLLFGLASILSKYQPNSILIMLRLSGSPVEVFTWIVLAGMAAGLLAGFPRWAYAYLGWAFILLWLWAGVWLPFLGVFLLTLLVRRSWKPFRSLGSGLWRDWTLLSFNVYILYAFVYMLYDSNHHPYLLSFMVSTTLAVSLGAWGYFRSTSPLRRVLSLSGGLLLAALLSWISESTWDFAAYHSLPESSQPFNWSPLIFSAILALLMLGNGVLARWRLARLSR